MNKITVKVPDELWDKIKTYCNKHKIALDDLVKTVLKEKIES